MKLRTTIMWAAIGISALANTAQASIIYSISPGPTALAPGGSGAVDVLLTNTGSSSISVGTFTFEVSSSSSAINLTGADFNTAPQTYLFSGKPLDQALSLSLNYTAGQTLDAWDSCGAGCGVTVGAGQSFALGRIFISVSSLAEASYTLSFTNSSGINSLSDAANPPDSITIDSLQSGTIVITPEPPTAILTFAALMLLGVGFRKGGSQEPGVRRQKPGRKPVVRRVPISIYERPAMAAQF